MGFIEARSNGERGSFAEILTLIKEYVSVQLITKAYYGIGFDY